LNIGSKSQRECRRRLFSIYRRIWKILCGRTAAEAINAAESYLTIAAGTGRSNLVSQWSANAVEPYTGLHSSRAKPP
jgi:hypothetical protein